MKILGKHWRTIWLAEDGVRVCVIDQRKLPHELAVAELNSAEDAAEAIRNMTVRGAPLIGATAAYGMWLAARSGADDNSLGTAAALLLDSRPTAVNLRWAVDRMLTALLRLPDTQREAVALSEATRICDEDVSTNQAIGLHGKALIQEAWNRRKQEGAKQVNILTHCNAGWLATVDWGTALAPVYAAHDSGIPLRVWVDETRPRNQGASLTAWELGRHGVAHTVIADNAGGYFMMRGQVDLCLVGSDRATRSGDICNKVGTYLKALAAKDNNVPFYALLPSSTIDWGIADGLAEIPIEERDAHEVTHISGITACGKATEVRLTPADSPAANPAFDVTPARLITGIVTERGICEANETGLSRLFPELGK